MEDVGCVQPGEGPVDFEALSVDGAIPSRAFRAEILQRGNASRPQALACKDADLDFSLIEPTGVLRREMHSEALPELVARPHQTAAVANGGNAC